MRTRRTRLSPLVLLAPATFFEGYDNFLLALALPLIRADFGLTVAQAGAVASIAFAGSFGVLLLLPLADRFGRRPLLTLTIVGYTVATFATAFSRGVADLAALQFVARVFLGTEFALAAIILVESVAAHERGRKLGTLSAATALGMAAAGGGFLLVKALGASWRALYLVGIVPLVVVAWARRGLPETRPRRVARVRLSGIVRPKDLLGVGGVTFLFAMLTTAVTTFASLLIFDEWGWGLSDLRPHYFLIWALGLLGFPTAGRAMDRWGRRPVMAAFLLGASVASAIAFTTASTGLRVAGLALVVFMLTGGTPCVAAYGVEPFPPSVRGRTGALLRAANIAGAALAPAATGLAAAMLGSVGRGLALIGSVGVIAALLAVLVLPETRAAVEGGGRAARPALTPWSRRRPDPGGDPPSPLC